jgi:hypothetical protein
MEVATMSNIYLVLTGQKADFKVCAAFEIAALANTYASAFKHHSDPVWVQEIFRGVGQDLRVGDKPYIVRFNRKGGYEGVVPNPPLDFFLSNAPAHRISEDQSTVEIFRWAPDARSAEHEAEARLGYAPLSSWIERP